MKDQPPPDATPKAKKAAARDLMGAVQACFSASVAHPPFPERLVQLAAALTTSRDVTFWLAGEDTPTCVARTPETTANVADIAHLFGDVPGVQRVTDHLAATVALPGQGTGLLLLGLPNSGNIAQSLAYERCALLSSLSFAQFRNDDLLGQTQMAQQVTRLAQGDASGLAELCDTLAALTGADYAAAALVRDGQVGKVTISGQTQQGKRAALPARLTSDLDATVRNRLLQDDRAYAGTAQGDGIALHLASPVKNAATLTLAAFLYTRAQTRLPGRRLSLKTLAKTVTALALIVAIGFVPIPDGIDLPAQVEPVNKRIITAPFTAAIRQVNVVENATVHADDTALVSLDTREFDIELISLEAERANAVLERETARANRNAALLRNAELEVARLDARATLLDLRKTSARITAPIAGQVLLQGLDQRVGATVRQGDALFEIADPTQLRLSLGIVERLIARVNVGQSGVFRPDFDPSLRFDVEIARISPALDNAEETPLVQARAELIGAPGTLRPGLNGVITLDQTFRPIWQVLWRNIRQWYMLRLWL
ncbi:MAG: efflux RND transporter periplasmic adaptor subunit [Sedimentitalea sp.]